MAAINQEGVEGVRKWESLFPANCNQDIWPMPLESGTSLKAQKGRTLYITFGFFFNVEYSLLPFPNALSHQLDQHLWHISHLSLLIEVLWSIGWVALSFLVCCLFVRPTMVTPVQISLLVAPDPPNPYIFWKNMIIAIQKWIRNTNTKTMTKTKTPREELNH